METQLLAIGYDSNSNYIKLPSSILAKFWQIKETPEYDDESEGIDLRYQTNLLNQTTDDDDIKLKPPYYFSIESMYGCIYYCGVIEFSSDEGIVMIPKFILDEIGINGSDIVQIKYVGNIPKGVFVQIEPLEEDLFIIPDLDEFLEKSISNYCLLFTEQNIQVEYMNRKYTIKIRNLKTELSNDFVEIQLVDIVNTDIKIDIINKFLKPEIKPVMETIKTKPVTEPIENKSVIFSGEGNKLGGLSTTDPQIIREMRLQRYMLQKKHNDKINESNNDNKSKTKNTKPDLSKELIL